MTEETVEITLCIAGAAAVDTAGMLKERLAAIGFLPHGRINVVVADNAVAAREPVLRYTLDDFDTPGLAAEKILDLLADHGVLAPLGGKLTEAEERVIKNRLIDLGYLE